MDDRTFLGAIVIAVLAGLLALMYLGWRKRQKRQSGIARPLPIPTEPGIELLSLDVLYAATTFTDRPLDRVAVAGLGYRARASVTVFSTGVVLDLAGEAAAFLPAADIERVERATWTIDRVVESRGLVKITWHLGDTIVDSYLRVTEPADPTALIEAVESIIGADGPRIEADSPKHDSGSPREETA